MFHVVVRIEVKPEKLESFLELVHVDAVGGRRGVPREGTWAETRAC